MTAQPRSAIVRNVTLMPALSLGLTLLWHSLVSADAENRAPNVFVIAPGDAERVPFDRADGICTLAEAIEAANDQGVSDPPLNDCGSASAGLNAIQLQAGNYDLTEQVTVINGGNTATFNIVTPIVIQGPGDESTAIRRTEDATSDFRFFHVGNFGKLTVDNVTLTGGSANGGIGDGAVFIAPGGMFSLTNSSLISNTARFGGGIYHHTGPLYLNFSTVAGNLALPSAPGELGGGSTSDGGGIYLSGDVTMVGMLIDTNGALNGAGIYALPSASATLSQTLVIANAAAENGGGIYSRGDMWLDNAIVWANVATLGDGGGLYIDSSSGRETDLRNSTIHGNQSPQGNGGGIWNRTEVGDCTTLSNVTVAENQAGGGNGGGFYHAAGRAVIASSTIVYNTASAGGGIFNQDLDSGVSCALAGAGDISSGVADLDSLSPPDPMAVLSGDITPSYALLGASQALNAGNPAACVNRAG